MSVKNYKEKSFLGNNLETTVLILQKHHEQGEYVCTNFNGKMLYSDTVTMNDAYLSVMGCTKAEFEETMESQRIAHQRDKEEYKRQLPTLIEAWQTRGKAIIDSEHHDAWERIVEVRARDIYRGMELTNALDVMEALNQGKSYDDVKEILNSAGHSGMSYSLTATLIKRFSTKGAIFIRHMG